jgi:mannose-6-phosphate isomerase
MTIAHAGIQVVQKPWGRADLRPWSDIRSGDGAIGELWFEHADASAQESALLLKLLFTTQPLSIQVHPDDAFARSIGLANGKSEAWHVLAAAPGAKVAVGLKRQLNADQLQDAIADGSIAELVQWTPVVEGDSIFIPAGTIHAIGAGLVIAEIQQRSDATFRLFDYGRQRETHAENAVAVSHAGPADCQVVPFPLTEARTQLVASAHFVLERIELSPHSTWIVDATKETWLLVLEGAARVGPIDAAIGGAVFLETHRTDLKAGPNGLKGLLAYVGSESEPGLLVAQAALPTRTTLPVARVSPPSLYQRATLGWTGRPTGVRS